jgi:hypothetical protein
MRQCRKLLLLVVLLSWLLGCEPASGNSAPLSRSALTGNPHLSFKEVLPEDWKCHDRCYRLDIDDDGEREWVILYYFDVLDEADPHGAPIGVCVYKLDDNEPPNIIAHDLLPPDGDYLCECECKLAMENILSGLEGDELVVRDRCDGETTRLTIFHWDADRNDYKSSGHFRGDHIEIEKDQVTVEKRQPGRAQVTEVKTYHPDENKTYYQSGEQCRQCTEEELCFCYGEPEDVLCFRYPEKVVLGFYSQYNDDEMATAYFVEDARDRLGRCDASECGCIAPRHQIGHVRVTQLEVALDGQDPDRAIVGVTVFCEHRDGAEEGERRMRWHLLREGGCWRLVHPVLVP